MFRKRYSILRSLKEKKSIEQERLTDNLEENLNVLRSIYSDCSDVVFRPFLIGGNKKATLIYIDGLANKEELDQHVLRLLMHDAPMTPNNLNALLVNRLSVSKIQEVQTFADCVSHISRGNPVLLVERENRGVSLGLADWEKRAIEEPVAESVVRGPREGFTETLNVNTSLLRRRIKSPDLKMRSWQVGRYTKTDVVIAYMDGIADKTLIEEVKSRIERIHVDGVLESGNLEELIEDNPFSPFPQLINTERVDVAVAGLLEGRIVILVDGTPFALVAPITFYSLLQSAEDYYQRFLIGIDIRWLRYLFVVVSLLFPSLYVAVITYHHEMVPTSLLISMARSREEVPFPAFVEALFMEIVFEGLREAGARMPKQIGAAVSIVGALVIGEAAVAAGLVSSPMVMVVAITGIASFMIPRYAAGIAMRMLRFPMIILAGTLGLLGITLGIISLVVHLSGLRSFGVPYLSPLAPLRAKDLKDVLIRAPMWMSNTRPHLTKDETEYRQSPNQKPGPQRNK